MHLRGRDVGDDLEVFFMHLGAGGQGRDVVVELGMFVLRMGPGPGPGRSLYGC